MCCCEDLSFLQPFFGWIKTKAYTPTNFPNPGQYISCSYWKQIYCLKLLFLRPNQHLFVQILVTLSMLMADEILSYLNLNFLMHSKVGSSNPAATFKTKPYATTVNNTSKELHHRYCIELELNIVKWSTKIQKGIREHPPRSCAVVGKIWVTHPPRCPKNTFPEIFHTKAFSN